MKAAAKEDKDKVKMSKTSHYINKNQFVSQQRSNLLTMNDRHQLEQDVMKPIEAGAGLFGLSKINLAGKKKEICDHNVAKDLPQNDLLLKKLVDDGLFIDSSTMFKNKDINVQKLEERLLNNGQREYFKQNGQIKINNDVLADELTRPADLAFEQSDAYQTIERNAIVTDRQNSFKKQYYRIDIILGRMQLKRYAQLFSKEDQMLVDLKYMCKDYDRRVALALIPFYLERLEYIKDQIMDKDNRGDDEHQDLEFLRTMKVNIERDLRSEKEQVTKDAQAIVDKWQEIEDLRKVG